MRKKGIVVLLVLLCTVAVFASGQKDVDSKEAGSEPVKLLIHNSDASMEKSLAFIMDHIDEECPGVEIELEMVTGSAEDYETKVRTLIAGGNAPDVWWDHGGTWATPILKAEAALALDPYLDDSDFWDNVVPSAKLPHTDGHIYAIPFENMFYEVMFYNTEIFEELGLEVPVTADELVEVVKTVKDAGLTPIAVAGKDGWPAAMMMEGFAYTIDGEVTKNIVESGKKLADSSYVEAAHFMKELIEMGAFSPNVSLTDYGTALNLFESGKAAMMANGSWTLGGTFKNMSGACDYFYYPALHEADAADLGKAVAGGAKKNSGIFVSSETKDPETAVQVAIAVGKLQSRYYYEINGDLAVPFIPEKFQWESTVEIPAPIQRLGNDMANFEHVYGLVQDVMPTAAGTTAVIQGASGFMTGNMTVDELISSLDRALEQ